MQNKSVFVYALLTMLIYATALMGQPVREKKNFDENWKFHLGEVNGAQFAVFNDSNWRTLDLPHDWSIEQPFSPKNASGQGYLPGGIGWYRKTFALSESYQDKIVSILFDGVYQNAEVWINGHYLGKRPFGFISFSHVLTPYLNFGKKENVLAVKVDHSHDADSRWYTGSGITRHVWLKATEPVHIAEWGTFVSTPDINANSATVSVTSEIVNETSKSLKISLENVVLDSLGETASQRHSAVTVPSHSSRKVEQKLTVDNPNLWDVDRPYLYQLKTLVRADDKLTDRTTTPFGIRSFRFDAQEGFFLNGESMTIKGVCLHNDAGALGSAVPEKEWKHRLELMKEMGVNALRTSHNPPAPELLDLADEMGFVVMDEAFDEWKIGKKKWIHGRNVGQDLGASGLKEYYSQHGYSDFFEEWAKKDIQAMVRRDRNHPSVIMWSIGNEVDYPNDPYTDPNREDYQPWRPSGYQVTEIARHLYDYVKEADSTRPVTAAVANAPLANRTGYASVLDVAGYNYQEQYYEEDHKQFPNRKITGSENGDSYEAWLAVKENDYIPGQFLWTGVDYLGEAGKYPNRSSGSGLVTLDNYRKPGFYFRKSLWNDDPMVYLAAVEPAEGQRWPNIVSHWNWESASSKEIKVLAYTNCESVELYLNGNSLGTRKLAESENHVLNWMVPYETGELRAVAKNNGEEVASYELQTAGKPSKIMLRQTTSSFRADGADIASFHVLVTDKDGNIIPYADNLIHFEVKGAGKNIGVGSADHNSTEPYKANYRKAYHGKARIVIQSTGRKGSVTIKATSEGLQSDSVTINAD